MTKEQALALRPGDAIYVVNQMDDELVNVEKSVLVSQGIQRTVLVEPPKSGRGGNGPWIVGLNGYLSNFYTYLNLSYEMFFTNPEEAMDAYLLVAAKLRDRLESTQARLDAAIAKSQAMVDTYHALQIAMTTGVE
jgi:hypothetical protein